MATRSGERLYFPFMHRIYERLEPLAWPMLRIAAGFILIPHGFPELFGTFAPVLAKNVLASLGLPAPLAIAYLLGLIEIVGGLMVAAGFLTRLIAAVLVVETAVIALFVSFSKGRVYGVSRGGAEFPSHLFVVYLALLFAGSGRFSVDRLLQREV